MSVCGKASIATLRAHLFVWLRRLRLFFGRHHLFRRDRSWSWFWRRLLFVVVFYTEIEGDRVYLIKIKIII